MGQVKEGVTMEGLVVVLGLVVQEGGINSLFNNGKLIIKDIWTYRFKGLATTSLFKSNVFIKECDISDIFIPLSPHFAL